MTTLYHKPLLPIVTLICLWFFYETPTVHAQGIATKVVAMKSFTKYESLALKNKKTGLQKYQEVDGNPFLYDDKLPADIVSHNGDVLENVPVQLDLYAQEFICTGPDSIDLILDLKYYKEIRIYDGDRIDLFKRVYPDQPTAFHQVLIEDGDSRFVKINKVDHIQMSMISGGQRDNVNRFDKKVNYEWHHNGEIRSLSLKKKKFFKAFSKKEAQIMKSFMENEDLEMKEENDYIAVLNHLLSQS